MSLLYSKASLGNLTLQNHLVMAPMTRNRATGNIPNELMVEYYAQRGGAGLIVTEGTSPSPDGLGYPRIPGIFSADQVAGWRRIANAVHDKGAKIFVQLMHCGRIGHALNLPPGARLLAPSAIAAAGDLYTDAEGLQPNGTPEEMSEADIRTAVREFAQAAENAMHARFDGVELHAANGYLLEQFVRPTSNQRTDRYGGSIEHRARFLLEAVEAVITAIGKNRLGVRLSPYGVFNDMPLYDGIEGDYAYVAEQLNARGILYIHLVDHSAMGAPQVPDSIKKMFRNTFKGKLILTGGYDAARAESDLAAHKADLIGVGRPFLANPDLVARWKDGAALNAPDMSTFYTPGPKGYTDYPALGG